MTYALIIVSKTNPRDPWPEAMHTALYKTQLPGGATRLNESAWLVPLDSCLLFLCRLVCIAHDNNLSHHVTFFEAKPSFVRTLDKESS
jgi:hypothetical protein